MNLNVKKNLQCICAILFLVLTFTACETEDFENLKNDSIETENILEIVQSRNHCITVLDVQSNFNDPSCCDILVCTVATYNAESSSPLTIKVDDGSSKSVPVGLELHGEPICAWIQGVCETANLSIGLNNPDPTFDVICTAEVSCNTPITPITPIVEECKLDVTFIGHASDGSCRYQVCGYTKERATLSLNGFTNYATIKQLETGDIEPNCWEVTGYGPINLGLYHGSNSSTEPILQCTLTLDDCGESPKD